MQVVDVIIVGAGPVGLMLANQLQRRGVSYRLLEARPGREYWCKALGISPRTLEIFDQMGILSEALACGIFLTAANTVIAGETVSRMEVPADQYPYGPLAMGQFDTEEVLEADLRRRGGSVEWSSVMSSFERVVGGVEVKWNAPSGPRECSCRYLVGCDGAHSLVRKTLGLAFDGERFDQHFFLGDVELNWERSHSEVWKLIKLNEEGKLANVVVVVPIPGNEHRYRLSMQLPPELVENPLEPLEMLQQVALPLLPPGTKIQKLRWASHYSISHRITDQYRKGNCFIAGDAAHIHPPIGGLGMNTGLQDAYNLGWKLAAVTRGEALETLLDTYHGERHRVGQEVVELTAGRLKDSNARKERDPHEEERANTQFFVNYRDSSLAQGSLPEGDRGAAPGERLDYVQGLRRPYLAASMRLIEFLRHGEFQLIGYGGEWSQLAQLAEELRHSFGNHVCCMAIADPNATEQPPESLLLLHDAEGQAQKAWGDGPGALLIRPDGYVGWRGRPVRDAALDKFLAQVTLALQA